MYRERERTTGMHPALAAASFEHEQKSHYAAQLRPFSLSLSLAHIESLLEKLVLSLSRRTEKSSSTKPPKENHRALGESENIKKSVLICRVCNARDTAELQRTKSNACFTHLDTHSLASTSKTLIVQ
jgi:hypothetical protein